MELIDHSQSKQTVLLNSFVLLLKSRMLDAPMDAGAKDVKMSTARKMVMFPTGNLSLIMQ